MTNFRKHLLIGVTVLALGAGSFAAYAQKPGGEHRDGRPMSAEDHAKFEARMKERFTKRQAALHDKLKLSPEQEGAWTKFNERMKPGTPQARQDRAQLAAMSAPERMEAMLAHMKEAEGKMAERVVATKEFYAVLTPEQQKTFNDEFAKGGPRNHRGMHH
ncbi:Spy/CpxP family protein refolding chaperone [Noviherbaspirillum cavernae]|nr:Spy/CpxP family protein refolding chaperone [Noviherbaspirillum cavernae]